MEMHHESPIGEGTIPFSEDKLKGWSIQAQLLLSQYLLVTQSTQQELLSYYKKYQVEICEWLKKDDGLTWADFFENNNSKFIGMTKEQVDRILLAFNYLLVNQQEMAILKLLSHRPIVKDLQILQKVWRKLTDKYESEGELLIKEEFREHIGDFSWSIKRGRSSYDQVIDFSCLLVLSEYLNLAPVICRISPKNKISDLEQKMTVFTSHLVDLPFNRSWTNKLELVDSKNPSIKILSNWYSIKPNKSLIQYLGDIRKIVMTLVEEYERKGLRTSLLMTCQPFSPSLMLSHIEDSLSSNCLLPKELSEVVDFIDQLEERLVFYSKGQYNYSQLYSQEISPQIIEQVLQQLVYDNEFGFISDWRENLWQFLKYLIQFQMSKMVRNELKEVVSEKIVIQEDYASRNKLQVAQEQVKILENKNRKLNQDIAKFDRLNQEVNDLKEDKRELLDFVKLINQEPARFEPIPIEEFNRQEVIAWFNEEDCLFVGGDPNWRVKMKQLFPQAIFWHGKEKQHNIPKKIRNIIFISAMLNHPMYYKLKGQMRRKKGFYQEFYIMKQSSSEDFTIRVLASQLKRLKKAS